ncbi:6323_t:CDS:2 [Entrophospora sp. SA101]|nr:6323_t:CDS:2 [Entrophospora sp. SA101]
MIDNLTAYILTIILGAISFLIYKSLIEPFYLSPLHKIPGPPSESILFGNLLTFMNSDVGKPHLDWKKKYGGIIVYHGFLNQPFVLLTDPKYYPQILTSYEFTKAKSMSANLKIITGEGILFAEGDQHKRQRKMMNPAFSKMVPSIINVANKLNNVLNDLIGDQDEKQITNINSYTSKVTLDVIGLVGFQYEFNSLCSKNELAAAYEQIFDTKLTFKSFMLMILSNKFKWIRSLPFEENIKLAKSIKIMTFLAAGHETTGIALSWALYLLAKHPEVQDHLRQELLEASSDPDLETSFDKMNSLEYLNCVFKETMRIIPPVPAIARSSETDTTIDGYFIPKDTPIIVSIYSAHHDSKIWGEDHDKFEPSRWLDPKLTSEINNYNYLPFLTGPRSCIGYKLAIIEFKIILFSLIKNFKFREVEGLQIKRKIGIVTRPEPGIDLYVSKVQ